MLYFIGYGVIFEAGCFETLVNISLSLTITVVIGSLIGNYVTKQ